MLYFDNAATSFPKPPAVSQAVAKAIETIGNPGRGAYGISLSASRLVYDTRMLVNEFFHGPSPLHAAFTANITEAMNAIISTMFTAEDHIITTCLEHNSVLRPLYQKKCRLSIIPIDHQGRLQYDKFEKVLNNKTKAVVCTHASNVTGNIINLDFVQGFCQRHQLLLILDTAQTAGFLPIHMDGSNISILCFTGHKSLLGPQGTGGILVGEKLKVPLEPFKAGGSGSHSFEKEHPKTMPDCFEAGTLNAHGLAGLKAGIEYIRETGMHNIREKEQALAEAFYRGIKNIPGIRFFGDYENKNRCPIVSFNLKKYDSMAVSEELFGKYGISTRAGAHCAPLVHESFGTREQGIVRFSFSSFNDFEEIEIGVKAVKSLI